MRQMVKMRSAAFYKCRGATCAHAWYAQRKAPISRGSSIPCLSDRSWGEHYTTSRRGRVPPRRPGSLPYPHLLKLDLVWGHVLDPWRTPRRRSKRPREVLRFVEYFIALKLVDIHCIPRLSVIRDNDFAYPNPAAARYSPHFRHFRIIRLRGALSNQVRAASYPFARLRKVADDVLRVNVARSRCRPMLRE